MKIYNKQITEGVYLSAFKTEKFKSAIMTVSFAVPLEKSTASGYSLQSETIVEVYHLWTDHDQRKHHRYFEVWIPITAK